MNGVGYALMHRLGEGRGHAWLQLQMLRRQPASLAFAIVFPAIILVVVNAVYGNYVAFVGPDGRLLALDPRYLASGITTVPLRPYLVSAIASLAVSVACLGILGLRVTAARTEGVLQRLWVSRTRPGTCVLGWLGSGIVVGTASGAAMVLVGWLAWGVQPRVDRALLLLGFLALGSLCFSAIGLLLALVLPSPLSAGASLIAVLFPLALLSGTFYLPGQAPEWVSRASALLPLEPLRALTVSTYDGEIWRQTVDIGSLVALVAWAIGAVIAAARVYRNGRQL